MPGLLTTDAWHGPNNFKSKGKIAICTHVSRCQSTLVQERPARLLPGVDAALNVTGRGEARILRGLHRHGRAFAEGAIEDDALAGGAGEFIEHAAGPDIGGEIGVGGVQRAGDDAMFLAFAALAQVDERYVGPPVER